ncbi:sigma-70 family RNA polymerase sigma factor [Clostridiaceae bacterium UIB06]|nr:sigma-70 family RNA polymerase sigma factor [Clostridiaceae bacterium UIB06]
METIMEVEARGQVDNVYLIKRAQRGDKEAIEEIVTKFIPFIIKTCKKVYVKGYELEDLVANSKMSIIQAINKYKINRRYAFTTYVVKAIKINLYRLIKYKVNSISEISLNVVNNGRYEAIEGLVSKDNIEDEIIENEEKSRLYEGIDRLSYKEKEIILWFYFKSRTLEEYARQKGVCYRVVVERKRSAIKKLNAYMSHF